MGLDVNLYAEGSVTDAQLADANAYLKSRRVCGYDTGDTPLERVVYDDGGERIEWRTLTRFYGPGYERGHWPDIHNAIVCLQTALPQCTVFYGSDSSDDGIAVTGEFLASTWAHWLGPDGQGYREWMRRVTTSG